MSEQVYIRLSKKNILIFALIAVVIVGAGVTVGINWNRWFSSEPTVEQSGFNPEIDAGAVDWQGQPPEDKSGNNASTGINIPGYPSITFPADRQEVTVALLNPEGNPCYFTFELVLKDTGEKLYQSKLVPPGQAISKIKLSRPLDAGEYAATIRISTSSLSNGSAMNGANVETKLIVQ